MGYESKIYIVEKGAASLAISSTDSQKRFAEVISMVEMCKYPQITSIFTKDTDCYFYGVGPDSEYRQVFEDCYGESIKEATLENLALFLSNEIYQKGDDYWRLNVLKAMVESIISSLEYKDGSRNIVALHYGH